MAVMFQKYAPYLKIVFKNLVQLGWLGLYVYKNIEGHDFKMNLIFVCAEGRFVILRAEGDGFELSRFFSLEILSTKASRNSLSRETEINRKSANSLGG